VTIPDLGDGPLEIILRTAVVYVVLVALLRIAGKREVGQLSILDLVTLLVISDAVQNSMVGENTTLVGGLLAAATLIILDRGLGFLRDRFPRFRKTLEGEPRLLIRDGVALPGALKAESLTDDELLAAVRKHGLASVDDVALGILETDGSISVIPKSGGTSGGSAGRASDDRGIAGV
jgi:uncharacterized membrane protein YcaP (DUF421 family)